MASLAALGVAAAVTAATREAVTFARELEVASTRSGDSVERLQALAFATGTVGISLEKLGDIGKDTNEKIGEFLTTGGGGFKDFIDVMRMTTVEGEALAEQFSRLSGTEVLQEMVKRMDAAGVSSNKMSFALEGMASDATDLIPLFTKNGELVKTLEKEFNDLNTTLTKTDINKIKEVGVEFDKFTTSFSQESRGLVARYSDEIIKALGVTAFLGEKSIDTFNVIASGWGGLITVAQAALTDFVNGTETLGDALYEATRENKEAINEFLGEDFYDIGVKSGEQLANGIAQGAKDGQGKALEIVVRGGKQLTDWEKLDKSKRIGVYQDFISASSKLSEQYMEDNKGVRSALVVMDTAAGVTRAFAENPFWVALGQSAVIVANGVTQLSNIKNATKGGGNVSSSGGAAPSAQVPESDGLATIDISSGSPGGTSSNEIRFAEDSGNDLADAIAAALNKGQQEGRYT